MVHFSEVYIFQQCNAKPHSASTAREHGFGMLRPVFIVNISHSAGSQIVKNTLETS